LSTAQEALRLARTGGERGHEAYALWLVGGIQQASGAYENALSLARELEMRPLAAQIQLDLGSQLATEGDYARAEEQTAFARHLFRQMDMRPWYDHSQSDTREIGHLYIVARSNPQLYEFLAQEFTGTRGIKVVLDRRERGQSDVSRDEERRRQPVDADLRAWELALTSTHDGSSDPFMPRAEADSGSPVI
jgi:tetratricopeptide (TPR) repeat protein